MPIVVERFWPGATEVAAVEAMEALRLACEWLTAEGVPVRYLSGALVPADELLSCRFDGAEQDVRAAHERAGLPVDRVLTTVELPEHDRPTTQGSTNR
jgi:hypothetical protein